MSDDEKCSEPNSDLGQAFKWRQAGPGARHAIGSQPRAAATRPFSTESIPHRGGSGKERWSIPCSSVVYPRSSAV